MPRLSIIIPTLNRYSDLRNTISFLQAQSMEDFEILIVDQTDQEESEDLSVLDERIHYHWFAEKSASAARNVGIKAAKGEILLFIDDDVIIENPDYLANHLRNYVHPDIPGVFGCTLEQAHHTDVRQSRPKKSYSRDNGWLFFPQNYAKPAFVDSGRSNNLSVRRSVAITVGGMDEQYEKGAHREEADFCIRLSRAFGPLFFDPEARLVHIGNAQGGIRSWQGKSALKSRHHFVGAMYFIFNLVPLKDYPLHLWLTLRYFILGPSIRKAPWQMPAALGRLLSASAEAWRKKQQGPKLLQIQTETASVLGEKINTSS
ncbi:MAG: glycosyltransferase family 2 protein [Bacteroidia bacterium]